MIKNYLTKQIKINKDISNYKKGETLAIKVDSCGIPIERYWRDRLKESKVDSCISFVESLSKKTSKKEDE